MDGLRLQSLPACMELGRCRGYGIDLSGVLNARGLKSSTIVASPKLFVDSSSVGFTLISRYVARPVFEHQSTTTLARSLILRKSDVQKSRNWGRPRRSLSGTKLHRWRAGGIQLPNPSKFWNGVKNPLIETINGRGLFALNQPSLAQNTQAEAETKTFFTEDRTVESDFPKGELSTAAIDCVEQFSRLNGLSPKKTRAIFESSAPPAIQDEARHLVEFTCFRYLARSNADLHPSLKDAAFRRLTFSAMLAWQRPYMDDLSRNMEGDSGSDKKEDNDCRPSLGLVGEEAFIRIAPAIAGVADRATVKALYHALVGDLEGLSFEIWDRYCSELYRIQKQRQEQNEVESSKLGLEPGEVILFVYADTRQPVQKWKKHNAWPGRLTLTDRALYFEANGLTQYQKSNRLDLTGPAAHVERKKVGPFGFEVFNSAISISSEPESEPWIIDFVDFRGAGRQNIWLAMIREIFAVYAFISEFGVDENDSLLSYVNGAVNGRKKAVNAVMMGIARLQAVQAVLGKYPEHLDRLLQFSYLASAPSGEIVLQALAVAFWGGRLETKYRDVEFLALGDNPLASDEVGGISSNLFGTDGTVYLRKWATSPSWSSGKANAFWRSKSRHKGLVLGKNHVVGGQTQVEKAVVACWEQVKQAEITQATIDGAMLEGIPSNLDLLQELFLPFSVAAVQFEKLRTWENPGASATFLFLVYGVIYMNWLHYVIPALLLSGVGWILTLRALRARGHLRGEFGKVTIREQPPTNTIEKVMALKEALNWLEDVLQTSNIILLKLRTVVLYREPRITNKVLWGLLGLGIAMLVVPFRYVLALGIADLFTSKLKFREQSVREFYKFLGEKWNTIPAAPVVVLPHEKVDVKPDDNSPLKGEALMEVMSEWLGEDNQTAQLTGGVN